MNAATWDTQDTLADYRRQFYLQPGVIYLVGNSLGLLSKPAEEALMRLLREWKTLGVEGWTEAATPWFYLAERLAAQTAPLLGVAPDEVILASSATVNLHQLLATLFQPDEKRATILIEAHSFPSDRYAIQSHLRLRGLDPATHLVQVASRDGYTVSEEDILQSMTEDVALVALPSVLYRSGQYLDMPGLTAAAHARGILIGFDLAHSIGCIPHYLNAWDVDFAFWCGYKYLNGGPGATGGLYLNRRFFGRSPGLAGWFSHRKESQFAMSETLSPAPHAGALQIGTPHLLSMAPLAGVLELIAQAGIENMRKKSLQLTAFLRELVETELQGFGFGCVTPVEDSRRGGHIALTHPRAKEISLALRRAGVIQDFRPPDLLRLAPAALYTSFTDCQEAVERLKRVMTERAYAVLETPTRPVT
jgi:kynureninase